MDERIDEAALSLATLSRVALLLEADKKEAGDATSGDSTGVCDAEGTEESEEEDGVEDFSGGDPGAVS